MFQNEMQNKPLPIPTYESFDDLTLGVEEVLCGFRPLHHKTTLRINIGRVITPANAQKEVGWTVYFPLHPESPPEYVTAKKKLRMTIVSNKTMIPMLMSSSFFLLDKITDILDWCVFIMVSTIM